MDGPDEPSERQLRDDPADAGVGPGQGRLVVEGQEDAGDDLDAQEQEDRAAGVVEECMLMAGDLFLGHERDYGLEPEAIFEPGAQGFHGFIPVS